MRALISFAVMSVVLTCASASFGAAAMERASAGRTLPMSAALLDLLRAEMKELASGTQQITAALPAGDWQRIAAAARQMRTSYILEKRLTAAQKKELAALPESFAIMDRSFHARTEKLERAAAEHDAEAAAYQFSRLLEACASCHAAFAGARFPNLASPAADDAHRH